MIELEITISPDEEVLGRHQFYLPKIYIGRSYQCQLPVDDPQCASSDICLQSVEKNLFICNVQSKTYYFNGKKISGKKFIRPEDQIKIGETTLALISYQPETIVKPLKINITQNPFENLEKGEELLKSIENELLFIEYNCKE